MSSRIIVLTLASWLIGAVTVLAFLAQERSGLPAGVTRITLPPGEVTLEFVKSKKTPTVKIIVGQTVIEGERLFLGDGKVAMEVEATKEGMHFPSSTGKKGLVLEGEWTNQPGAVIDLGTDYLGLDQLKAGSVYVITPSVKFRYEARPKLQPKP
jgi:hypothetical protein